MYLTTVRIRRARARKLPPSLGPVERDRLAKIAREGDVIEVMAHGQTIALVTPTEGGGLQYLWEHPGVDASTAALVKAYVKVMGQVQGTALVQVAEAA